VNRSRINLLLGETLKALLRPAGYTITPLRRRAEYIDAEETIQAARSAGQTVPEYVASLWGEVGVTEAVVGQLAACGALEPCARVVEIGPGTGRYLAPVLERVRPAQYDSYELDDGWAEYLTATHGVTRQETDGESLPGTPDASCGLVQAHNVFVYLKPLVAFRYFQEMARVCAPGGFLVFDYYPDEEISEETLLSWLEHPERYPVLLSQRRVNAFFEKLGFRRVHAFPNRCYRGVASYEVYRKAEADARVT